MKDKIVSLNNIKYRNILKILIKSRISKINTLQKILRYFNIIYNIYEIITVKNRQRINISGINQLKLLIYIL